MSDVQARLRAELTAAMRARDRVATRVLRTLLSAVANAEARPVGDAHGPSAVGDGPIAGAARGLGAGEADRRLLSDEDVLAVVRGEREERVAAASELLGRGASDRAATLHEEIAVLDRVIGDLAAS